VDEEEEDVECRRELGGSGIKHASVSLGVDEEEEDVECRRELGGMGGS
jgi:hypothetical protein